MDLMQRRRELMMMGGGGALKRGSITLNEATWSIDIQHRLNSSRYFVLLMHDNPDLTLNSSIGGFADVGIDFTCDGYNKAQLSLETRSSWATYSTAYSHISAMVANSNSCLFVPGRSNGYRYQAGSYKWLACDLAKEADYTEQLTLSARTQTIQVTHNLGTSDVLVYIECTNPIYNTNAWLGAVLTSDFFDAAKVGGGTKPTIYYQTGTSTQYADTSRVLIEIITQTLDDNVVSISTKFATYPFMAGNYTIKIYKL